MPVLKAELDKSSKKDQMVIISFSKEVVVDAKQSLPDIPVYWLRGNFKEYALDEVVTIVKENKLDGLDLNHNLVTSELMKRMDAENLEVHVYTVNDPKVDHKNLNLDVDFMQGKMASCEILVEEFWKILAPEIQKMAPQAALYSIRLYETPKNYVEFFGEGLPRPDTLELSNPEAMAIPSQSY